MADKVKVTLVKSPIGAIPKHRATVKALGLTKMHKTSKQCSYNGNGTAGSSLSKSRRSLIC